MTAILRDARPPGPHDWRQPLALDRIKHFYAQQQLWPGDTVAEIALLHFRMWRHILEGDQNEAYLFRRALVQKLCQAGETIDLLDRADQAVLDELMDVIRSRFRRTPAAARSHCMALLESATILVQIRQNTA